MPDPVRLGKPFEMTVTLTVPIPETAVPRALGESPSHGLVNLVGEPLRDPRVCEGALLRLEVQKEIRLGDKVFYAVLRIVSATAVH